MAGKEGQWLTQDEVLEIEVAAEKGLPRPEKFDSVVFDNTRGGNVGGGYRYATVGELKAAKETADADASAADKRVKALEKAGGVGANELLENRQPVADVDAGGRTVAGAGVAGGRATGGGANAS